MKVTLGRIRQLIREASVKHPLPRGTRVMLRPFEDRDSTGPYQLPAEEATVVLHRGDTYTMVTKQGTVDVPEDQVWYVLTN